MDLTDMMEDRSLSNLDWLNDPKTYEPQDKDINKKDDLAIEWSGGVGDLDVTELPTTTIKDEMVVQKPDDDVRTLVEYAHVLLNQGIMGVDVVRAIRGRFYPEVIKRGMPELRKVMKDEGFVGTIAVDLRGTKNHKARIAAARKSPYWRFMKCVIMDRKDALNSSFVDRKRMSSTRENDDGTINGFFAGNESYTEDVTTYAPLGLKVVTSREDLDESEYDNTLIDIINLGGLDEGDLGEGTSAEKCKKAFKLVARKNQAERRKSSSVNVANNPDNYKLDGGISFDLNKEGKKIDAQIGEVRQAMPAFEIEMAIGDQEISLDGDQLGEVSIEMNKISSVLYIDDKVAGIEVEMPSLPIADLEIDEQTFVAKEFKGGDEFNLDDKKEDSEMLQIDAGGSLEWE